jgi:hypothetical protein
MDERPFPTHPARGKCFLQEREIGTEREEVVPSPVV